METEGCIICFELKRTEIVSNVALNLLGLDLLGDIKGRIRSRTE